MPQLRQIPGTNVFVEFLLTVIDAPRTEPGWSHEFEEPHRWGYGTVYRLVWRLAIMVGRLEPEPVPKDFLGSESENLRLIGAEEIDRVRANLDEAGLRIIQRGYRPWYADQKDWVMYELKHRMLKSQGWVDAQRRKLAGIISPDPDPAQTDAGDYTPYQPARVTVDSRWVGER